MGEASHPGPPRSDLRRLRTSRQGTLAPNEIVEPTVADIEASVAGSKPLPTPSTVVASASRRRRPRLRPLPWSWDSDSEPDGPARADGDLPVTVPASPRALLSAGLLPEHQFPTSGTQISPSRVLSVPEVVLDALESDLAVADQDGPVEVFAMTDDASEEVEGRPHMGRRVVLVPQSADGTPRSISMIPIPSKKMHWTGTVRQPSQPSNHWVVMTLFHQTPPSGESLMCRLAPVQFPKQNQFQWWRKCPWVQHFGTHCDGWTQWIYLAFFLGEQWS